MPRGFGGTALWGALAILFKSNTFGGKIITVEDGNLSDVLLRIKLGSCVLGGKPQRSRAILIPANLRCALSTALVAVGINLDVLAKAVCVRSLHCTITRFPLSALQRLQERCCTQPASEGWGVTAHAPGDRAPM